MTSLWDDFTSWCEFVRRDLSNAPNLHIALLLCAPPGLLVYTAIALRNNYPGTYAVCYWNAPGEMRTSYPECPFNRHVFETPTHRGWPAFYIFVGATLLYSLIAYRNRLRCLLQGTFWLHFLITTVIRVLSIFSGWSTQPNWSSLVWNSNSVGKIFWLWLLVESRYWSWSYLGFYDDYYFREETRTVHNRGGDPVWTFTSEKTDDPTDMLYFLYSLIFRPWRDIAVRLSYIHLVDNAIHVIWFRYFHVDAPYTAYINNSEILTILLFVTLAVYTYARMRTHVYFDDNVTGPLVDIKSTVPLPIRSASRDLFTFASTHHVFRTCSERRQAFMIALCLMTTGALATWELHLGFKILWALCFNATLFMLAAELEVMRQTGRRKLLREIDRM